MSCKRRDRGNPFPDKDRGEGGVKASLYRKPGDCDSGYAPLSSDWSGDGGSGSRIRKNHEKHRALSGYSGKLRFYGRCDHKRAGFY